MSIATVQIRLIADSQAEAVAAIAALRDAIGSARLALSSPHKGRKGGQWLAYGTLQVEAPTADASHCAVCSTQIVQPAVGRRRKYCAVCVGQLGHRTPAAAARKTRAENATA